MKTLSAALTQACWDRMNETGESGHQLAIAAGIPQPVLSRFLTGSRDIRLQTADALAAELGLTLRKINDPSPDASETVFRRKLQEYLDSHPDVTQRALGREADVSHVHIQHILKGKAVPTLAVADKIARAIGVRLGDLIG